MKFIKGTIDGAKASYIKIAKGDDSTENAAILDWDYARNRLAGGDTKPIRE